MATISGLNNLKNYNINSTNNQFLTWNDANSVLTQASFEVSLPDCTLSTSNIGKYFKFVFSSNSPSAYSIAGYNNQQTIYYQGNSYNNLNLYKSCLLYTSPSPRDS